jgi:hypothetical protein
MFMQVRGWLPNDVLWWYLNLKTFRTTEPAGDANPISARANSLAMDKKAISYFKPNCTVWCVTTTEGNPCEFPDQAHQEGRGKKTGGRFADLTTHSWSGICCNS